MRELCVRSLRSWAMFTAIAILLVSAGPCAHLNAPGRFARDVLSCLRYTVSIDFYIEHPDTVKPIDDWRVVIQGVRCANE